MSEERENLASRAAEASEAPANLGAPVAETEASATEVLEAVERATSAPADAAAHPAADAAASEAVEAPQAHDVAGSGSHDATNIDPGVAPTPEIAEQARREAISEVDTQLNIDMRGGQADPTMTLDELPSATEDVVRDGEIRVAADHPMAALYMQSPMPPELRGNRGAGVLIALLATVGFAIVGAGIVSALLAPSLAPSQFVDGLVSNLLSWGYIVAILGFFVGLAVLVLIVGRAGWWAYVLGGFFVGAFVWVAATIGLVIDELSVSALIDVAPGALIEKFGLSLPAIAAGLIGREVTIWFGAWIGARGRRVKQRNADAIAEYEIALAEVQAKQA
ncbi:hypothetical protein JOF28_002462 [Leucobacter exalbidus]|uniref:Uncharacterized protein n=1 Tax=Leucobacter exalbidus TaxID=662960 RepID=A0A940PVY4_9MICO|nr:hypothetical protein [Leucobacter exalbidus]MBP1327230.1 hypothetical protein [Leucobacter exalbidus]